MSFPGFPAPPGPAPPPSYHQVLSSKHNDTVAAWPSGGDLIVGIDAGGGSIKWQRFAVGPSGGVLYVTPDGVPGWNENFLLSEDGSFATSGNAIIGGDLFVYGDTNIGGGGGGGLGNTVAQDVPADYTSINAALNADATILNIIGYVYEGADVLIPISGGLSISIFNDSNLDMAEFSFVWQDNSTVSVGGPGQISHSGDNILFDPSGNFDSRLITKDIKINSYDGAILTSGNKFRFSDCAFNGDIYLDGIRNKLTSCDVVGDVYIMSNGSGIGIHNTDINGLIFDSGNSTIISDVVTY